jgi:hypothetical protein
VLGFSSGLIKQLLRNEMIHENKVSHFLRCAHVVVDSKFPVCVYVGSALCSARALELFMLLSTEVSRRIAPRNVTVYFDASPACYVICVPCCNANYWREYFENLKDVQYYIRVLVIRLMKYLSPVGADCLKSS